MTTEEQKMYDQGLRSECFRRVSTIIDKHSGDATVEALIEESEKLFNYIKNGK